MPIIICINHKPIYYHNTNNFYDYKDRILKNIDTHEHEVFYCGQAMGRADHYLVKAINDNEKIKIYYRTKNNMPFTYLGETNVADIVLYRSVTKEIKADENERLQTHIVIRSGDVINRPVSTNNFTGPGKFKKDILLECGLIDVNYNKHPSLHTKDINQGFYYYQV